MKKRVLSVVLAMCLTLSAVCYAEGGVVSLVNAAEKLAFETHNVTLNANARFLYDGEWFKTFTGEYRQDGENSAMIVSLDTPREDGKVYTGGYTVVGNGPDVYFSETYSGNYYTETIGVVSDTVLRETTLRRAFMSMAQGAAGVLNEQMAENVRLEDGTVTVNMSGAPALVNSALTYAALRYIERNYGYVTTLYYGASSVFDDYEMLGMHLYEEETGEKVNAETVSRIYRGVGNEADMEIYNGFYAAASKKVEEVMREYDSGTVWFHNDGTWEWFETNDDYLRAAGIDYIYYEDYSATFRSFYEKKYGKELSAQALDMLMYSTNEEFWTVYYELVNEMDEYYRQLAAKNPETVSVNIFPDGTYEERTTSEMSDGMTVTRRVFSQMKEIAVGNVDAAFTISEAGDALSGKGTAEFTVTDFAGNTHTLTVEFDCTAGGYGSTSVGKFDPKDYGLVTYQEYMKSMGEEIEQYEDPATIEFPETMEFGERIYELFPNGNPMAAN